jgi:hypothetical protein
MTTARFKSSVATFGDADLRPRKFKSAGQARQQLLA